MSIVGIGVDVCEIARLEEALLRSPGLVHKVFTPSEARRRIASLAGRWAAKEALAKALGAPGMRWLDAEVCSAESGQPSFRVSGTVADRCRELGVVRIHLSISHDGGIATAFVICETE